MRRFVSVLLLCALTLSVCMLGGCMSRRERAIKDALVNNEAMNKMLTDFAAVFADESYINKTGFAIDCVDITEEVEQEHGMLYRCDVTVANEYVAVTIPSDVTYDADDEFRGIVPSDSHGWSVRAVGAIASDKIGLSDLPNNDVLDYSKFEVKKVKFDYDDQTCTVNVFIDTNSGRVIASGEIQIKFAFENNKWVIADYVNGKDFAMSWDIGGLWSGDEYKWNKSSTLNLRIDFSVDSIESDGKVNATVHSHIIEGKSDNDTTYTATGSLDFVKLAMTLNYENEGGPCQIVVKLKGNTFNGKVIGTADGFQYYSGKFVCAK